MVPDVQERSQQLEIIIFVVLVCVWVRSDYLYLAGMLITTNAPNYGSK